MSEIKVNSIKGVGATNAAITVNNTDGTCTANITSINSGQISGRRNMIINGGQRVAQRGSAAVTVSGSAGYRSVDRFKTDIDGSGGGDFSHGQSTDVPTGQGFSNSSKITVVTQASQPSGISNRNQFYTMLEEQDVAHLEWGTSAAKTCTLSFWVKSSVAGTYTLYFRFYGATAYSYYTNYTINSADTWEKKVITITGHTSGGNVPGTISYGFLVEWSLGNSSGNETGTLNEWTTSGTIRAAAGSVYLPENSGATWYITGVQFEVGSQASDFEFRSVAEETTLCQRYYFGGATTGTVYYGSRYSTDRSMVHVVLPVLMRTTPTVETPTIGGLASGGALNTIYESNHMVYYYVNADTSVFVAHADVKCDAEL